MILWHVDFSDMIFLDCLANISGPALVACQFGFHEVHSIELFEDGAIFSQQLAQKFGRNEVRCCIRVGRLQVAYIRVDSHIMHVGTFCDK